jgi:hypothetical protein
MKISIKKLRFQEKESTRKRHENNKEQLHILVSGESLFEKYKKYL